MLVVNPFREARLNQGLSQEKLSTLTGISRLSILRLEQGLFATPLGKVSLALGLDHRVAARQYYEFQRSHRHSKAPLPPVGSLSFTEWRIAHWPSQVAFCTSLCVSQASLHRYESRPNSIMPGQLREALEDAGLSTADIANLRRRNAA